ncbi:MAG TPA: hypothetical protein VEK15_23065 [Vicinamibacteria bacterium]|nr:hypothetical protein [Vicinamibacteria bacterium]
MSANVALFEFMIGDWNVDFHRLPVGAKVGRHAIAKVGWFLDGTAILDEWRHLDESGSVNFRGATFRTYIPDRDLWYMLWMTPAVEGFSELYARGVGEEVETTGKGKDSAGDFLERGKYCEITDSAFSFVLERSYEKDGSFIPFVSFRAARMTAAKHAGGKPLARRS